MIYESQYWKEDLLKLAGKLERRLVQTRWGDRNFYAVEKEIFLGFYIIRKLIESKKISDHIVAKKYKILEFPLQDFSELPISSFNENIFEINKAKKIELSVISLCNQFIHSYHFAYFLPNEKNLTGFFFCSDRKRTSGLYFITLFDIVYIYRAVGNNYPVSIKSTRLSNGKAATIIE